MNRNKQLLSSTFFKGTVVNQALLIFHRGLLKTTLTVPLTIVHKECRSNLKCT